MEHRHQRGCNTIPLTSFCWCPVHSPSLSIALENAAALTIKKQISLVFLSLTWGCRFCSSLWKVKWCWGVRANGRKKEQTKSNHKQTQQNTKKNQKTKLGASTKGPPGPPPFVLAPSFVFWVRAGTEIHTELTRHDIGPVRIITELTNKWAWDKDQQVESVIPNKQRNWEPLRINHTRKSRTLKIQKT